MKRALVLGLGVSGRSAATFLSKTGVEVVGVDCSFEAVESAIRSGIKALPEDQIQSVSSFDLLVISPGVSPSHILVQKALANGIEIVGELELALRHVKGKVLGVTGTNGKTSVTRFVEHALNLQGIKAIAVGNVGVPFTSQLDQEADVWVVEVSSYQLETMKAAVFDAGVILNITPDHLDRYSSFEEYVQTKAKLKKLIKPHGSFYIQDKLKKEWGIDGLSFGFDEKCDLYCDGKNLIIKSIDYLLPEEYRGKVSHELENFIASFALCQHCSVSLEQVAEAVRSFTKPSHRLEWVADINGVHYYNDSKGTNIDAVIRAVECLNGHVILIAGGVHKGAAYTPWIDSFAGKVVQVYALGQSAQVIKNHIGSSVSVEIVETLEQAVLKASVVAKPGENVLLSPGCASFDMFRNYEHRGDEFKKVVKSIGSKT